MICNVYLLDSPILDVRAEVWFLFVSGASFGGGAGGPSPPPPPPRKKKKEKKKEKKEKREKKRKKKERKKETMNNVKLLHIKCWFFQFFNSPVALKNFKKIWPPPRKSWNDASGSSHSTGAYKSGRALTTLQFKVVTGGTIIEYDRPVFENWSYHRIKDVNFLLQG